MFAVELIFFSLPAIVFPSCVDGGFNAAGGHVSKKKVQVRTSTAILLHFTVCFSYKNIIPLKYFNKVVFFTGTGLGPSSCATSSTSSFSSYKFSVSLVTPWLFLFVGFLWNF